MNICIHVICNITKTNGILNTDIATRLNNKVITYILSLLIFNIDDYLSKFIIHINNTI
jgi:hypothetical protein